MNKKIVGYRSHRLNPDDPYNADECKLNEIFNKYIKQNKNFWDLLVYGSSVDYGKLGNPNIPEKYLSEHELKIVATIIQWLGTPVGKGFLYEVDLLKEGK